jgi:adenine deaminase
MSVVEQAISSHQKQIFALTRRGRLGRIIAELALPLAGLMSLEPFEVCATLRSRTAPEPFLQVAFLALPVIPRLKLTDMGLFDVDKFSFVD